MRALRSYTTYLAALGLIDHQLLSLTTRKIHFPIIFLLAELIYRATKLVTLGVCTLAGSVLLAPIFVVNFLCYKAQDVRIRDETRPV
jgi:hypothetical protein